jgi:hypothetical protein
VGRQEKCWSLNASIADPFQQVKPGNARHRDVENETIKPSCQCRFESGHPVFTFIYRKTEAPKILGEQQTHVGVVVCD